MGIKEACFMRVSNNNFCDEKEIRCDEWVYSIRKTF